MWEAEVGRAQSDAAELIRNSIKSFIQKNAAGIFGCGAAVLCRIPWNYSHPILTFIPPPT